MGATMVLLRAIPALPIADIDQAVALYAARLGFEARHREASFAIVNRDEVEIHLWLANGAPGSGAEPHLAGSASCRIRVTGLGALSEEYRGQGVIHPNGELRAQWWGDSDFTISDQDHNAIAFSEPAAPAVPAVPL